MNALRLLHLRRLREQPLRTIVALVAVAGGVSLTLGVFVARASIDRSFEQVGTFLDGPAALRVHGPVEYAGLDDDVVPRVAAVDGVAAAVPVISTIVVVTDGDGDDELVAAFGVDCGIEAVLGDVGCDPALIDAGAESDVPLLTRRLAGSLGAGAVVRTDAGVVPLDGAPATASLDQLNQGKVVIWPIAAAQRLLGREGRLDMVLVVPEPGIDSATLRSSVEVAVGAHNVVRGADEPVGASFVTAQLLPGLLLTSLAGLVVGMQLVHTTFVLALEERRRELAVAAAVGATPRRIAAGLIAEAAVIGAAGGLLGTAGAAVVGRAFVDSLSVQVERTAGLHLSTHVPPSLVAVGLTIGVVVAVVAAVRPARAAARLDLAGELSERDRRDPEPKGRKLGLAIALAGTVVGLGLGWLAWRDGSLAPWQPTVGLIGMLLASSCAFRLPGLLAVDAVRLVSRSRLAQRGPLHVAVGALRGDPGRAKAVTNALGVAAALTVTLGAVVPALEATASRNAKESVAGGVLVSALAVNNSARIDSKLPPDAIAALTRVDGVDRLTTIRFSRVEHPDISVAIVGTDGTGPNFDVLRGSDRAASFAAGQVMIGPAFARSRGLSTGDTVELPGVDGPVELTVGGIWSSSEDLGRSIHMSNEQFAAVAGARPAQYHVAVPERGVSPDDLARRIRAANLYDRAKVLSPEEFGAELAGEVQRFVDPFLALQRALLLVGFVATGATLLLAAVQRRRELATLAAVGMPPADLARVTLAEAGVLGVVATVVGTVAGYVAYASFVFLSQSLTGLGLVWVLPWSIVPLVLLLVVAVALAGAAWPAWRSTRIDPAIALRYE